MGKIVPCTNIMT